MPAQPDLPLFYKTPKYFMLALADFISSEALLIQARTELAENNIHPLSIKLTNTSTGQLQRVASVREAQKITVAFPLFTHFTCMYRIFRQRNYREHLNDMVGLPGFTSAFQIDAMHIGDIPHLAEANNLPANLRIIQAKLKITRS